MRRPPTSTRHTFTHLTALVVVPGCIALGWWQLSRALSGNSLSWAYVFEWPIFAGYGVFMWWKLTHEQPSTTPMREAERSDAESTGPGKKRATDGPLTGKGPGGGDNATEDDEREDDAELASYNDYLAALNASGRRKHW